MPIAYIDTETCGLYGVPVIIQYALDEAEPVKHDIWGRPAGETLDLIDKFCQYDTVFYNATFDWFQLTKIYNLFLKLDRTSIPEQFINELGEIEPLVRDGVCLKPRSICDIFLQAKKTVYQSVMDRKPIQISRIPTILAQPLADKLDSLITFKPLYFARKKDSNIRWQVENVEDRFGNHDPEFKNLVLRFAPSARLKDLAMDALKVQKATFFADISISSAAYPVEYGWAPFAKAHAGACSADWLGTWPEKLKAHINHWRYNTPAIKYSLDDVRYTREIYKFLGSPAFNDDDSVLAAMVATTRWKGFKVDLDGIRKTRAEQLAKQEKVPTAPKQALIYLQQGMTEEQKIVFGKSTKKQALEQLVNGDFGPVSERAKEILEARTIDKEIELYDKLLQAGRFHPSLNVIGTLSSRMSGTDGLNAQGIKHADYVRKLFPFVLDSEIGQYEMDGGDFDSFEVSIADVVYPDPNLHTDLTSGKKIHALFGSCLFEESYDDVKASKGTDYDMYSKGKQGVFTQIYGGDHNTLMNRLGISEEVALAGEKRWAEAYPDMAAARAAVFEKFQALTQPGGIGTKIYWKDPADFAESLFGHRRYFTLEISVMKSLFQLAQNLPPEWLKLRIKCVRRDRDQFVGGATCSALYGASFGLQGVIQRAAGNHRIQATGAQATKKGQCKLWELQPVGAADWVIRMLNVHDEIMAVRHNRVKAQVKEIITNFVKELKQIIPLAEMEWKQNLRSWCDK